MNFGYIYFTGLFLAGILDIIIIIHDYDNHNREEPFFGDSLRTPVLYLFGTLLSWMFIVIALYFYIKRRIKGKKSYMTVRELVEILKKIQDMGEGDYLVNSKFQMDKNFPLYIHPDMISINLNQNNLVCILQNSKTELTVDAFLYNLETIQNMGIDPDIVITGGNEEFQSFANFGTDIVVNPSQKIVTIPLIAN